MASVDGIDLGYTMRIVTRPDFDGVVCAVLLFEALEIGAPVKWVEPNDMQKGLVEVAPGDIIANLPYDKRCSLWFDHHYTNRIDTPFNGVYKIAPSAASVIYEHYRDRIHGNYSELVAAADKVDAADLTQTEVLHPETNPYVLLSMTIHSRTCDEAAYWDKLVAMLRSQSIETVMEDPEVQHRCRQCLAENEAYKKLLEQYTVVRDIVSITDFRPLAEAPAGNRFLVFSLFPDAVVNVKVHYDAPAKDSVAVHLGHSIFNRRCRVNVGLLLAEYGGGGHRGAGGGKLPVEKADEAIRQIVDVLLQNESNEIET